MCVKFFLTAKVLLITTLVLIMASCSAEQAELLSEGLSATFNAASAYEGGRAQGYATYQAYHPVVWQPQHGTMNTLINGQPGFINY